jgi:hypothetical protein
LRFSLQCAASKLNPMLLRLWFQDDTLLFSNDIKKDIRLDIATDIRIGIPTDMKHTSTRPTHETSDETPKETSSF